MSHHATLVHEQWPAWQLEDCIGEGSYGVVYRARRTDLDSGPVAAIKVIEIPSDKQQLDELLAEGMTDDQSHSYLEEIVRDVTEEISLMEKVKGNTNIVSIEDYAIIHKPDSLRWTILIRMEMLTPLLQYVSLHHLVEEEIIKLGTDLCTALAICEKNHIVHRDIKPENIFINRIGDFKLGDFGVAKSLEKITLGLSRKGTPNYMAPELYNRSVVTTDLRSGTRMDIYSIGLVLYWLSNRMRLPLLPSDRLLTPKDRSDAFLKRIQGQELPAPCEASPELARIILKACAYQPENRYEDADALKYDLMRISAPDDDSPTPTDTKAQRKKLVVLILLAVILLGSAGYAGYRYWPRSETLLPVSAQDITETASVPAETADHKTDTSVISAEVRSSVHRFRDKEVEIAVHEQLHRDSSKRIYQRELSEIHELDLGGGLGIVDISDLTDCVNLEVLLLDGNGELEDISPLSGLTRLRKLELYEDYITDLSPLRNMGRLEELDLNGNGNVMDLTPLSGLTSLKNLYLGFNSITDITPLSGLTNLETVHLNHNNIVSVAPLLNLPSLKSLDITDNPIEDWDSVRILKERIPVFRHDPIPET